MRVVLPWLTLLIVVPGLGFPAWAQEKPEPSYSLQIVRASESPLRLTLDASQAPAAEVLRALAKESGLEILVSDGLTVPVTAKIVGRSPEAIILHIAQMKGIRIRAVRVPSSFDTKKLTAEKLASVIDTMGELGFTAAAVPPIPKRQADAETPAIAPPVTLLSDPESPAKLAQAAPDCRVIWVAVPDAANQKPQSETLGELARLNQRAAELLLKLTPEEHKAYLQMQVEYFRQMPLQLQQRTLMDGMSMMLGLTPKEQGALMAGMFRLMSPEQKKAFLNLGTAFIQNVTPEEIPQE